MACLHYVLEEVGQYLKTFSWNKKNYRVDKPIGELIDMLQKVKFDSETTSQQSLLNQNILRK